MLNLFRKKENSHANSNKAEKYKNVIALETFNIFDQPLTNGGHRFGYGKLLGVQEL
jgi:hypothetical protein